MTKAYAIAYLRDVDFGDAIVEYLKKIDDTLAQYGGHFLTHATRLTPLEGEWGGDLVIIEFPSREDAERWYESPGYQEILPLRTEHSNSMACVITGVPTGYRAKDGLAKMLAS